MLALLLLYLLIGACSGVLAGLFGVGGGTVIVPALILTLAWQGVSPEVATHIAIGTSLAAISVTSLSSIHAHQQRGAVDWPTVARLAPGLCIGVWLGALLASVLSGSLLQLCFGVFLVAISLQLFFNLQPASGSPRTLPAWPGLVGAGSLIGALSALFGIGGGSLTVPFLHVYGVAMQRAVATAAAAGFPIAVVGALSYAWNGWGHPALPADSSGFIYWPAFAGIAVASIGFARLGAQWAHALEAQRLRRIFALFLLAIGIWFLIR